MSYSLKNVLIKRDGISACEADSYIEEARARVHNGENLEHILFNEFGLEPDYIFDLLQIMDLWQLAYRKLAHLYTKEEIDEMTFGELQKLLGNYD